MTLEQRSLGSSDIRVSAIGLGCMGMSEFYGANDRKASLNTIAAALDAGVTLFDTGDFYGMGHNELLLAEGLKGRRERAFIQVKTGALRDPSGAFNGIDARPVALKNNLAYSLKRLNTEYIDLYMTGGDPSVPIKDVIGAMGELVQQGYIRHVGLTNVDADTIRRAHQAFPVTAVQFEYSLITRDIEQEIIPLCRELGIGITAYGVLSRGLLTGSKGSGEGDVRSTYYPRFQGENLTRNEKLARVLAEIAAHESVTAAQVAIGWVASQGDDIIPLIGSRTPERLHEALQAPRRLPPDILTAIEAAIAENAVYGNQHMVI